MPTRWAALGVVATTAPPGGTPPKGRGWRPHYSPHLHGRHVVNLPDADGPGRRHAAAVAAALRDVAASVVVVDLHAGRRGPWDVRDWLARGGTLAALEDRVRQARYAAAGLAGAPRGGAEKASLVLATRLGSTEKLVLLAVGLALAWGAGALPTAAAVARACGLHRVTAQRVLAGLRGAGILAAGAPPCPPYWPLRNASWPATSAPGASDGARPTKPPPAIGARPRGPGPPARAARRAAVRPGG
jgi:hypothetical protein